jgi:hypothetical protein
VIHTILSTIIILSATQLMAGAPMSSKKIKVSEKCPQMLKGFEAAKKLTIPDEQKELMLETLKKNGCLK